MTQKAFDRPARHRLRGPLAALAIGLVAATGATTAGASTMGTADMATPGISSFSTFGTKWGSPAFGTAGGVVTYSYVPFGTSCGALCGGSGIVGDLATFMPVGFEAAIDAAFGVWEAVADISFVEVADDGAEMGTATTGGDIRLSVVGVDGPSGTLAFAFFPPPNSGTSYDGDIFFDFQEPWSLGVAPGFFDLFLVAAHEIGHAIGLEHEDTELALMNPIYNPFLTGLTPDDIAGAQYIYGPASVIPLPAGLPLYAGALMLGAGFVLRRRKAPADVG
ncbi:matrixin family metalloprotease [Pseudooceanicola sp. LIPI14-2-Ac024]|uniref:matrixin family metalloprotease n=1 Tax=Pseudooceanicola sp. LIPI14-2-Ac024 TaxID=3344875 RepID=UPI0035D04D6A